MAGVFTWVYDWKITDFPDNEAVSSKTVSNNIILEQIESNPELYAKSLAPLIKQYNWKIQGLLKV